MEAAALAGDRLTDAAASQVHWLSFFKHHPVGQPNSDRAELAGLFPKTEQVASAPGLEPNAVNWASLCECVS